MTSERRVIIGLPGSGKTEWCKNHAKESISAGESVLIVDPLHDVAVPGATSYYPRDRIKPVAEVNALIRKGLIEPYEKGLPPNKRYRLAVFDECSRYFIHAVPLSPEAGYLNDFARHMDLSVDCVARRITQMHTDLSELAHEHIIFKQAGINDLRRLDELKAGLSSAVDGLTKYEYVVYHAESGEIEIHQPIAFKSAKHR
jgi:hypothetical protein